MRIKLLEQNNGFGGKIFKSGEEFAKFLQDLQKRGKTIYMRLKAGNDYRPEIYIEPDYEISDVGDTFEFYGSGPWQGAIYWKDTTYDAIYILILPVVIEEVEEEHNEINIYGNCEFIIVINCAVC